MQPTRRRLLAGFHITSLGTLTCRVLGLLRDMATASLLGLSGGAMDALVLAFRIPNFFRAILGEGALASCYLPVLSKELLRDRQSAWRLVTHVLVRLGVVLSALVLLGELLCGGVWLFGPKQPDIVLTVQLAAIVLPYLLLICLAAQVSATLQALSRFALPALAPALLSIVWLAAAIWIAPRFAAETQRAMVLAWAILASGALQLLVPFAGLWRLGFRPVLDRKSSHPAESAILSGLATTGLALCVTRVSGLLDSLIAWGFTAPHGYSSAESGASGTAFDYPLHSGAVAALYYAERLYQFPLGLLGVAIATVIFPLLSRHAARGQLQRLGADLTYGLKLVLTLAFPASAGLVLLGEPIARLLFERGEFTAADTSRTGRLIAMYGAGVWASCLLPVMMRGYFAVGNRSTPFRTSVAALALNVGLNMTLIWPLQELGLALATTISTIIQAMFLTFHFSRNEAKLDSASLWKHAAATLGNTVLMFVVGYVALRNLPEQGGVATAFFRVAVPLVLCLATYGLIWLLCRRVLK